MPASPCSSDSGFALALAGVLACALGACAAVRPAERERLADPAMRFDANAMAARHEQHVADNREGSAGGGTAKGGGCGCN